MICSILIETALSAVGALIWCVMVMFFCMCIEHIFFKKEHKSQLTEKEIILIKEVLAGHISLPLVANDGLFVECVDRIERIFQEFIVKSRQQTELLENKASSFLDKTEEQLCRMRLMQEYAPTAFPFEIHEPISLEETDIQIRESGISSGRTFDEILNEYNILEPEDVALTQKQKEAVLESSVYSIRLPVATRNVFRKRFCCKNVRDVLLVMLSRGSQKALLEIYMVGEVSVQKLEAFMLENSLMSIVNDMYVSDYWDEERYNELYQQFMAKFQE